MKSRSIVRQLLTSMLLMLLVLWVLMVVSVAWVIKHETDEIFDASLQETAQRLLPLAVMQLQSQDRANENPRALETNEDALEPSHHEEYMVYQVFDAAGHLLLRSHAAPALPLVPNLKQGFQRTPHHLVYIEKNRSGEYLLAIAEKSSHRTDTLLSTLKYLLMPLLALLPLSALSMLLIARRARKPLQMLAAELSNRGGSDLKPVSTQELPKELKPLADTLNRLMHRLKSALDSERNFTANSAHELRTPLAAAMAQLHILEKTLLQNEQQKILQTAQQMLQRLQNLSAKLLQLARAESGIAWKSGDVNLGQLLEMLCQDYQWRSDLQLELSLPDSLNRPGFSGG